MAINPRELRERRRRIEPPPTPRVTQPSARDWRVGGGLDIRTLVYRSQEANYILCRSWDGSSEGGTDIAVAKPWLLRRRVFDLKTYFPVSGNNNLRIRYVYAGNDARDVITEERVSGNWREKSRVRETVYPEWDQKKVGAARDFIYAFAPATGTDETRELDGEEKPITLLDMNQAARGWKAPAGGSLAVAVGVIEAPAGQNPLDALPVQSDRFIIKTDDGSFLTVAKPHELRHSFNTRTRKAGPTHSPLDILVVDSDADPCLSLATSTVTPQQVLKQWEACVPRYRIGSRIVALNVGEAITGIAGVSWLDANQAARVVSRISKAT